MAFSWLNRLVRARRFAIGEVPEIAIEAARAAAYDELRSDTEAFSADRLNAWHRLAWREQEAVRSQALREVIEEVRRALREVIEEVRRATREAFQAELSADERLAHWRDELKDADREFEKRSRAAVDAIKHAASYMDAVLRDAGQLNMANRMSRDVDAALGAVKIDLSGVRYEPGRGFVAADDAAPEGPAGGAS